MQPAIESIISSGTSGLALAPRWTITLPNGVQISPNIVHAVVIVLIFFIVILIFARFRRMYVGRSIKESAGMVGFGFFVALFIEGLLILGGRTLFTEIIGWENAPKPISVALDAGRNKLVNVLGVTDTVPESSAQSIEINDVDEIIKLINRLPADKREELFKNYCSP